MTNIYVVADRNSPDHTSKKSRDQVPRKVPMEFPLSPVMTLSIRLPQNLGRAFKSYLNPQPSRYSRLVYWLTSGTLGLVSVFASLNAFAFTKSLPDAKGWLSLQRNQVRHRSGSYSPLTDATNSFLALVTTALRNSWQVCSGFLKSL